MAERQTSRDRRRLTATVTDLSVPRQRALLVALAGGRTLAAAEASLAELGRLADTAGSDPVASVLQQRLRPDPATYVGRGKAQELAADCAALDIDVVVADGELSPVQQRNLQQACGCDVVDRVALILDIFAQHATSREGMAQVELALLRYRLPRLRGRGIEMSRLAGGIGTRGPGESQLETDRRRVQQRIRALESAIEGMGSNRETQRKARVRSRLPGAALVGYTNSGKSSLLNRLTGAGVLVEDRLFSTLDTTTRKLQLPSGGMAVLSDTVGFVDHLPHQLVDAFRSTLYEAVAAELLIHVVDAAAPDADRQIAAVRSTLVEIGAGGREELLVANKADVAPAAAVDRLLAIHPGAVAVSAITASGLDGLLEAIDVRLSRGMVDLDILLPHTRGDLLAALHRSGEVISESHGPSGSRVTARIAADQAPLFLPFAT
jgi:GTP-binding protein HflX